jgi:hypothetical protein
VVLLIAAEELGELDDADADAGQAAVRLLR